MRYKILLHSIIVGFLTIVYFGCSGGGYVPGAYEELVYLSSVDEILESYEMDEELDAVSGKVFYYVFDMPEFDNAFYESARLTAKVKQLQHSMNTIPTLEELSILWNILPEEVKHTLTMPDIEDSAKDDQQAAAMDDMLYNVIDELYYDLDYKHMYVLNSLRFAFRTLPNLKYELEQNEQMLKSLVTPTPEYEEDAAIYASLKFQIDSTLLAIQNLKKEIPSIFSKLEPTITAIKKGGTQQQVVMHPDHENTTEHQQENTQTNNQTNTYTPPKTNEVTKNQVDISKPELQDMVREIVREELSKHTFTATDTSDQIMGVDVYNRSQENELRLRYPIFTDGNLYCIQVSSWQNEKKAFEEANRLIAGGLNAFVVKEYVEEKRSNWFRVRVGYFDTLDKAKQFMNKFL